jgi:predicted phosphodiesterase
MRALVISDIHSNLPALEAVLAAAPQYDAVWNLGDIVGYGANPNEVVELVKKLGGIIVRGNHDRACSGTMHFSDYRNLSWNASAAALWTQKDLKPENAQWLSNLKRGPLRPLGRKVACVHGSTWPEDEYIRSPEDASRALSKTRAWIVFSGHTHFQGGWSFEGRKCVRLKPVYGSGPDAVRYDLLLSQEGRYVLNPGSVGQPRDGDWRAAIAVFDDDQSLLTWYRVPYKVLAAQRRIRRAGLPKGLATRLRKGQ